MSQEVVLVAVITVAPGKWDRMNELFAGALKYMQENEPGTLEFRVFQGSEDSSRGMMIERYASQEALEKHQQSEAYQKLFQTMSEEQILSGAPEIIPGKYKYGFWKSQ